MSFNALKAVTLRCGLIGLVACMSGPVTNADTVDMLLQMHAEGTPGADDQAKMLRTAFESFREQKFEECLKQLDQAREKYANLPPGRVSLALFLLDFGQFKPAQQQLEIAISQQPDLPLAHDAFGRLALVEGRITDAELQFRRALELVKETDWDDVRKARFGRECELGLASVAERRLHWAVAQEHLQKALTTKSDDPGSRRRLGQALFHQGLEDEAYQELVNTENADDSVEPATLTMARLHSGTGNHKEAEAWFKRAWKTRSDDKVVAVTFGSWLLDRGRESDAEVMARKAAEADPDDSDVRALLGMLAMAMGKYEEAEKHFQSLYTDNPGNFDYANLLALALVEQTDTAKQQKALELAEVNARQFPRNQQALATLGWVYHHLGKADQSQKLIQSAGSGGRMTSDTVYYFARIIDGTDRESEVQLLLEKALENDGRFFHRRQAKQWLDQLVAKSKTAQPDQKQPDQKQPDQN